MDNRREFLKKAAMLTGGMSLSQLLPQSIAKAMAINPTLGSTFYDAEHVVLLMQENRSFDHAFGTLRGVRGFNDPRIVRQPNHRKVWLQSQSDGKTYAPFRLDIKDSKVTWMGCLPHNWTDQTDARNQGKMDRWLDVKRSGFKDFKEMPLTLGHYTREDIPFYYAMADAFTICDQHFCSSLTGTNPNRLYFWTGNIREKLTDNALVWNGDSEFSGKATWKTFPERLTDNGVDWKIYQNEISSSSEGYSGQENSWLGNFGCNVMEYFPQYAVKYSKRYQDLLIEKRKQINVKLEEFNKKGITAGKEYEKLQKRLQETVKEQELYTDENFEKLSAYTKEIHRRAFVNNSAAPDYMELEQMEYQEGDETRQLQIPKGDILHQFRADVDTGKLPTVSWLTAPQLFSDHPDSPWFGAWYVSEVMDILTKNPEVWQKTIFILTYDENDGYFDHVAPFAAPNPYRQDSGKVSQSIDTRLEYVRKEEQYHPESGRASNIGLGYRVPMIIASPWSRGGWVNSQVFDHTSPLQFLERFISHKIRSNIKETNITAWRRAVCGDLTSAFRTYKGEVIAKPEFVQKKSFIKSIHQAQYKDLPKGFKPLDQAEIDQIEQDPRISPYFPKQEKGSRDSCGLPYELYVDGYFDQKNQAYQISFEAANRVFGSASAGAAFTVYSETPYDNEQGRSWNYATVAGDRLQDSWSLDAFDHLAYRLSVYGPNGFFRTFAGSKENPKIKISCRYEHDKKGKGFTGRLLFEIVNQEDRQVEVLLQDNSYGQATRRIKLGADSSKVVEVDLSKQHFWYDIKVSCTGYLSYFEQFAGRIEVGGNAKSDPLMA